MQCTLHLFFIWRRWCFSEGSAQKATYHKDWMPSHRLSLNIPRWGTACVLNPLACWCMLTPESLEKACQSMLKRELLEPNWFESMHINALAEAIRLWTANACSGSTHFLTRHGFAPSWILGNCSIPGPPGRILSRRCTAASLQGWVYNGIYLPAASGRAQPQPFESQPMFKKTQCRRVRYHPACNVSMGISVPNGGTVLCKARFWGHIPWISPYMVGTSNVDDVQSSTSGCGATTRAGLRTAFLAWRRKVGPFHKIKLQRWKDPKTANVGRSVRLNSAGVQFIAWRLEPLGGWCPNCKWKVRCPAAIQIVDPTWPNKIPWASEII